MSSFIFLVFLYILFQVAGLLSALMAMIVTLAVGFLLDPLPKVNLRTASYNTNEPLECSVEESFGQIVFAVSAGRCGYCQPEGHADAGHRSAIPVEERQSRLCKFLDSLRLVRKKSISIILSQLEVRKIIEIICPRPGDLGRHLFCIHPAGAGSWIGCRPWCGADQCRHQGPVVSI